MLSQLGHTARPIRRAADLAELSGLILPGGESTTLSQLLDHDGLREAIADFADGHPVLGTCAGLILMSAGTGDARVKALHLLDVEIVRNHYGRQRDSFIAALDSTRFPGLRGTFIRAPVPHVRSPLEVLATHEGTPVAVRQGRHIGCSFHPELGNDLRLHEYWLSLL